MTDVLHRGGSGDEEVDNYQSRIPTWVWLAGLAVSAIFCTAALSPLLHMKVYEPIAAVILALLVAVLAVRALGQTDLVGVGMQTIFPINGSKRNC